jgi:hypothetical protein
MRGLGEQGAQPHLRGWVERVNALPQVTVEKYNRMGKRGKVRTKHQPDGGVPKMLLLPSSGCLLRY